MKTCGSKKLLCTGAQGIGTVFPYNSGLEALPIALRTGSVITNKFHPGTIFRMDLCPYRDSFAG